MCTATIMHLRKAPYIEAPNGFNIQCDDEQLNQQLVKNPVTNTLHELNKDSIDDSI
jgi:hypothetical protein